MQLNTGSCLIAEPFLVAMIIIAIALPQYAVAELSNNYFLNSHGPRWRLSWNDLKYIIENGAPPSIDVWHKCVSVECKQLELSVTLSKTSYLFIEYKFKFYLYMVRQNLFMSTDRLRPKSIFHRQNQCLYQHYNPSFGAESFVQNGFRYLEMFAVAYFCPDEMNLEDNSDFQNSWRFLYVYFRNPFGKNVDYFMVYHREYDREIKDSFIKFEIVKKKQAVQRNDMSDIFIPIVPRHQLHPLVFLLRTKFRVAPGGYLDIWRSQQLQDSFLQDINSEPNFFGQMLAKNLKAPLKERRRFIPYFKLAVYYHPGTVDRLFTVERELIAAVYMADFMLRRIGMRLLVTLVNDLDTLKEPEKPLGNQRVSLFFLAFFLVCSSDDRFDRFFILLNGNSI